MFFKNGGFIEMAQNTLVKSRQEIEIAIPAGSTNQTFTLPKTVNKNKTLVIPQGWRSATGSSSDEMQCRIELTNNTTATAFVNSTSSNSSIRYVRALLIEFWPWVVKNIDHGTATITNTNSAVTVNAGFNVSTASNVALVWLGNTTDVNGDGVRLSNAFSRVTWGGTVPTQIFCVRGNTSGSLTAGYCLIEFYAGVIDFSVTKSISMSSVNTNTSAVSINPARCLSLLGGFVYSDGFTTSAANGAIQDATRLVTNRLSTGSETSSITLNVIQFNPKWVRSRQSGIATFGAGAANKDIAITGVNVNRLITNYIGFSSDNAYANIDYIWPTLETFASDTLRLKRASGTDFGFTPNVSWEALELA